MVCKKSILESQIEKGICISCRAILISKVRISRRGTLKIIAGGEYSSHISKLVLAAKEDCQLEARKALALNLSLALDYAAQSFVRSNYSLPNKFILIPIPSRKVSDRKRGYSHIQLLINELQLVNQRYELQILDCLSHTRRIRDQSALNLHAREMNMRGAFSIDNNFYRPIRTAITSSSPIFFVDDLVTTGATVQAANSALLRLGVGASGVLASCATDGFTH
jgi:predicted amidophosphoribosyltransferase